MIGSFDTVSHNFIDVWIRLDNEQILIHKTDPLKAEYVRKESQPDKIRLHLDHVVIWMSFKPGNNFPDDWMLLT